MGVQACPPRFRSAASVMVFPLKVCVPAFTSFARPASSAGVLMVYSLAAVLLVYQVVSCVVPSHALAAAACGMGSTASARHRLTASAAKPRSRPFKPHSARAPPLRV